jgi:hypothetical protein
MEEIDRLREKKRKKSYFSGMRKHAMNQPKKLLC